MTLVNALIQLLNSSSKKPNPLVWQYAQPRKFKMTHFGKVVHFDVLPVRNPVETSGIHGEFDVDFLWSNLTLSNFPISTCREITKIIQIRAFSSISPLVSVTKVSDFTRNKKCCQSNIALVENYQMWTNWSFCEGNTYTFDEREWIERSIEAHILVPVILNSTGLAH